MLGALYRRHQNAGPVTAIMIHPELHQFAEPTARVEGGLYHLLELLGAIRQEGAAFRPAQVKDARLVDVRKVMPALRRAFALDPAAFPSHVEGPAHDADMPVDDLAAFPQLVRGQVFNGDHLFADFLVAAARRRAQHIFDERPEVLTRHLLGGHIAYPGNEAQIHARQEGVKGRGGGRQTLPVEVFHQRVADPVDVVAGLFLAEGNCRDLTERPCRNGGASDGCACEPRLGGGFGFFVAQTIVSVRRRVGIGQAEPSFVVGALLRSVPRHPIASLLLVPDRVPDGAAHRETFIVGSVARPKSPALASHAEVDVLAGLVGHDAQWHSPTGLLRPVRTVIAPRHCRVAPPPLLEGLSVEMPGCRSTVPLARTVLSRAPVES